jgi:eukaryotic-like serine/threonine-protein kinase
VIGRTINNYEIKSVLGQGAMGSVYLAEHPVLRRRAAIKVLKREYAQHPTEVSRFINEARAASAVRHPGIIEVYDVGTLPDGLPYLMMEMLEGETLAHRLGRLGRLELDEAVDVAIQAGRALAAAHDRGIVHRDLKPDNLFLVPDPAAPGRQKVKVLDFGIAKLLGNFTASGVRTHTGSMVGTPLYMSPEQCRGISSEVDHRADVYTLGVILYEMLTGAPPFVSEAVGDLLVMHLEQAPRLPRELDAGIPDWVEAAVLRALEKDRAARFATAADLVRALSSPAARTTVREAGPKSAIAPEPSPPIAPPFLSTEQMLKAAGMDLAGVPRRILMRVVLPFVLFGLPLLAFILLRGGGPSRPAPVSVPAAPVITAPAPAHPPVVVTPPVEEPAAQPVAPARPAAAVKSPPRVERVRRVPVPASPAPAPLPAPAPVEVAPAPAPPPPPAPAPPPRVPTEKW